MDDEDRKEKMDDYDIVVKINITQFDDIQFAGKYLILPSSVLVKAQKIYAMVHSKSFSTLP